MSRVLHDVPPFMLCEGAPARPRCINIVALKRHEFTTHVIDCLAEAHRLIYRAKVGVDPARVYGSYAEMLESELALPEDRRIEDRAPGQKHSVGRDLA